MFLKQIYNDFWFGHWIYTFKSSYHSNNTLFDTGIHSRQRFMLIPFVGCLIIIMAINFPVHVLSNTIAFVCLVIWGENCAPWDGVVNGPGACVAKFTLSVCPIMKNISLKISSEEALILYDNNKQ